MPRIEKLDVELEYFAVDGGDCILVYMQQIGTDDPPEHLVSVKRELVTETDGTCEPAVWAKLEAWVHEAVIARAAREPGIVAVKRQDH
jgi:hypothetical protein